MVWRLYSAIVTAVAWTCLIGAICNGGVYVYNLVIDANLFAQVVACGVFALLVFIGWIIGGDDDGEDA
jgi:hypothetical protein